MNRELFLEAVQYVDMEFKGLCSALYWAKRKEDCDIKFLEIFETEEYKFLEKYFKPNEIEWDKYWLGFSREDYKTRVLILLLCYEMSKTEKI
jgi:hypothetical protein